MLALGDSTHVNAYKDLGGAAPSTWSSSGNLSLLPKSTSAEATGIAASSVAWDSKVYSESSDYDGMSDDEPFTVVAVTSISAEPDVVCVGNSNIAYTVITQPAGFEYMVNYTPADTSTPGVKEVVATCGTSAATCTVRVLKVEVKPESFVDVREGYKSSDFTAHTFGVLGDSYSWFMELPTPFKGADVLKNLEHESSSNKARIVGYWYAFPIDKPSASCIWYINCTVTFGGVSCKDEIPPPGRLRVTLPSPGGKTTTITSIEELEVANRDEKYWAVSIHIKNTVNLPVINVPVNSPFYNKIQAHENKHYEDFTSSSSPITLGEKYFSDSSVWTRMVQKNITSEETTPCKSQNEVITKIQECWSEEAAELEVIAEERAYNISDPIWPEYFYQSGSGNLDGNMFGQ